MYESIHQGQLAVQCSQIQNIYIRVKQNIICIQFILLVTEAGRSLMNNRNKSGASTVPWGTPDRTSAF